MAYAYRAYNETAEAWLSISWHEESISRLYYEFFDFEYYNKLVSEIRSKGYKYLTSNYEKDKYEKSYTSQLFLLNHSANENDERYSIELIVRNSFFDFKNGEKILYYDDNKSIEMIFNLENGKLNGYSKKFNKNGTIQSEGSFKNGEKNGLFRWYTDNGILSHTETYNNGLLDGDYNSYFENGEIKIKGYFKSDKKEGKWIGYTENGDVSFVENYSYGSLDGKYEIHNYLENLHFIEEGTYLDGELYGKRSLRLLDSLDGYKLIEEKTYRLGILNGPYKEIAQDSVIIGHYLNGQKHGETLIYFDFDSFLGGKKSYTDTSSLTLISKGSYNSGNKEGKWSNYFLSGDLSSECYYAKGKLNGTCKYYHAVYKNDEGHELPYSRKLKLIENYNNGQLHGKVTSYSRIEEEPYLCDSIDETSDTCYRNIYLDDIEQLTYTNGKLHGLCEVTDIDGKLLFQGTFKNEKKDGKWIESWPHQYNEPNDTTREYHIGEYINGNRTGTWSVYILGEEVKTENYLNGKLHGECHEFFENGRLHEIRTFENGYLKSLKVYDSIGSRIVRDYKITEETEKYFKVIRSDLLDRSIKSQEFFLIKQEDFNPSNLFDFYFTIKSLVDFDKNDQCYPDGKYTETDQNGKLLVEGSRYKSKNIGLWNYYFHDQGFFIQQDFDSPEKSVDKFFTINDREPYTGKAKIALRGDLTESVKVKNGFRHGKSVLLNNDGEVLKKTSYKLGIQY